MGLYNLVRSKGYKNFMAKLYGIGAAVVILGALFKLLHLPGANIMLIAGMGTEAIIFIFSAFEPLHVEYNWALVYPELAIGNEEELKPVTKKAKKEAPTGTVTQQLDKMLEEAKIGPELIESLATGMRNLSENAKKISGTADAAAATDGYIANLTKAGEKAKDLSVQYEKTTNALMSQQQTSDVIASSTKQMEQTVKAYAESLNASLQNTMKYQEEVNKLTQSVQKISSIYGNMLAAMSGK
jgi:gliding motility-associated protein GldL